MLAACDEDLLGKDIDGFTVSQRFYGGELVGDNDFLEMLDKCTIANMVGQRVIKLAKKKSLIRDEGIITLSGVPHAQMIRML